MAGAAQPDDQPRVPLRRAVQSGLLGGDAAAVPRAGAQLGPERPEAVPAATRPGLDRVDGKTVVRAGGGLYYAPTVMSTFIQSILFNGGNPELGYSVSTTNAAALAAAFQAAGVNLSQAPLDNLPVFTAEQVYGLLGGPSVVWG